MEALALVSAILVSVPALAAADQYLYTGDSLAAEGVQAIQQHTVYLEIIAQNEFERAQVHQFAAVVALVKRCDVRERRVFDNAVLWFNDQFLFGEKRVEADNFTEAAAELGVQPREDYEGRGGHPNWDTDNSTKFQRRFGNGTSQPANDAAAPRSDPNQTVPDDGGPVPGRPGRWVGCFVPEGFLHAIGTEDPYVSGAANGATEGAVGSFSTGDEDADDASDGTMETADTPNVELLKTLIDLDNHPNCRGCIFNYTGSFYITDPNGYAWIIDKYTYPAALTGAASRAGLAADCDSDNNGVTQAENLHLNSDPAVAGGPTAAFGTGCDAEAHRDSANDDHCYDGPDPSSPYNECEADRHDPTDTPRRNATKITTLEPLFTVHLQVDVDAQGIRDEAQWAWRETGLVRPGAPRWEADPWEGDQARGARDDDGHNSICDTADATPEKCEGLSANPSPRNYCPSDRLAGEMGDPTLAQDVRCSIEYTALLVVDFEGFDDVGPIVSDTGEDEITRNGKLHGTGARDDDDTSKNSNSHRHNPAADGCDAGDGPGDGSICEAHSHDTVELDLFFKTHRDGPCLAYTGSGPTADLADDCGAPHFAIVNGGFRDGLGGSILLGRPPVPDACNDPTSEGSGHPEGIAPIEARVFIVCDLGDNSGDFHAHDGSQTITAVG